MRSEYEVAALVRAATARNRRRDRIDREAGFAPPTDCDDGLYIRTAVSALECGLALNDWECVADAAALLRARWWPLRDSA